MTEAVWIYLHKNTGDIEKYILIAVVLPMQVQYLLGFAEPIGPLRVRLLTKQYMKSFGLQRRGRSCTKRR